MSKKEKLLSRLLSGNADANFIIDDLVNILMRIGFEEERQAEAIEYFLFREYKELLIYKKPKMARLKAIR